MDEINEVIKMINDKLSKEYFYYEIRFLETILNKLTTFKKDFEDDCK